MTSRVKYSIGLLCLGVILALLPSSAGKSLVVKPEKLFAGIMDDNTFYSVDQVARFVVTEDSTTLLIDLRPSDQYMDSNIPGSSNIPYEEFLDKAPGIFFNDMERRFILYSNGDLDANFAFTLARGLNCNNVYVMKGGLNEWYKTIMNSGFSGEKISARENALFETRARAGKLFDELNRLPDSLKIKYMESKRLEAKKLDGGCD